MNIGNWGIYSYTTEYPVQLHLTTLRRHICTIFTILILIKTFNQSQKNNKYLNKIKSQKLSSQFGQSNCTALYVFNKYLARWWLLRVKTSCNKTNKKNKVVLTVFTPLIIWKHNEKSNFKIITFLAYILQSYRKFVIFFQDLRAYIISWP
jgi:hypothetical protein